MQPEAGAVAQVPAIVPPPVVRATAYENDAPAGADGADHVMVALVPEIEADADCGALIDAAVYVREDDPDDSAKYAHAGSAMAVTTPLAIAATQS